MIESDKYISNVARAVEDGLSQTPKRLPGWLFYDEAGDKLFQAIMKMPEYYLTRCEYEILESNKDKLQTIFSDNGSQAFNLIELGAGDGFKTEILLKHFSKNNSSFVYTPIDVSQHVLNVLKGRLLENIPGLVITPINDRYDDALQKPWPPEYRNVFLLLGANIGNFSSADAIAFGTRISEAMKDGDQLMIGFDLKKNPRLIQAAYDDQGGITREFNLNLLARINTELGADFKIYDFAHYPCYDPVTGQNKSYLVSKTDQDVRIKGVNRIFHLDAWEVIHTEISQKYDKEMIEKFAARIGLRIVQYFYDRKNFLCDVLLTK